MVEHVEQEGNVGLDAADTRLGQGSNDLSGGGRKALRCAGELIGGGVGGGGVKMGWKRRRKGTSCMLHINYLD
jgi:hypothetical protein